MRLQIEESYRWANKELLDITMNKESFYKRLHKIKSYFFLDKGDFFLNLMELAEDELKMTAQSVSLDKL